MLEAWLQRAQRAKNGTVTFVLGFCALLSERSPVKAATRWCCPEECTGWVLCNQMYFSPKFVLCCEASNSAVRCFLLFTRTVTRSCSDHARLHPPMLMFNFFTGTQGVKEVVFRRLLNYFFRFVLEPEELICFRASFVSCLIFPDHFLLKDCREMMTSFLVR